jgi:hypothetical protein
MRIGEPISFVQGTNLSGRQIMSSPSDYSDITAAMNKIMVKVNCPDKFRAFIYCLAGMADNNYKLQTSDTNIATYARGRIKGGGANADKGWARDKRRDLVKWLDEGNPKVVEIEVQDPDPVTKKRPPTIYTVHILQYAEQVVSEAKKNKSVWSSSPTAAIEYAADDFVANLLGQQVNTPQDKYIDPSREVVAYLKTARTNLFKVANMLKKYNFQLMREDEKELRIIEKYIKSIRDRGFVDDPMDAYIFSGIKKPKP